ncbi:Uncharacterised protein [Vibrio cholerae]|nr:Uncharacterised protein [Vibrio cholerae]
MGFLVCSVLPMSAFAFCLVILPIRALFLLFVYYLSSSSSVR